MGNTKNVSLLFWLCFENFTIFVVKLVCMASNPPPGPVNGRGFAVKNRYIMTPFIDKLFSRSAKLMMRQFTETDSLEKRRLKERQQFLQNQIRLAKKVAEKRAGLLALLLVVLFSSCTKSNLNPNGVTDTVYTMTTVQFYSTNASVTVKQVAIEVSGKYIGIAKYSKNAPACGAAGFPSVSLKSGDYKADVVDPDNTYATRQVSFSVQGDGTTCISVDIK